MGKNTSDHFEGKTDQQIEEMKQHILRHLRGLSNQSMSIPIPAQKDLTVTELISEVESLSPAGKAFMNEWMDTLKQVERLRKKKS